MHSLMWPLFFICIQLDLVATYLHAPSLVGLSGSRRQLIGDVVQLGCPIHKFSSSGTLAAQQFINCRRSSTGIMRYASDIGVRNMALSASGAVSDVVWVRPSPRGSKDIVFGGR